MCGRFTLHHKAVEVAEAFELPEVPSLEPRYNIAPSQPVFAVRSGMHGREGVFVRWGLIPSWAADATIGYKLLNARSETILEKPSFRTAFLRRRCLIPADGFYEWRLVAGRKQPMHFRLNDERLFALAGLWEQWQSPEGVPVLSCTILTTAANDLIRPVHDRMPVILPRTHYAEWLGAKTDAATLISWLTAWPANEMCVVEANPRVNQVRNEGPGCLANAG